MQNGDPFRHHGTFSGQAQCDLFQICPVIGTLLSTKTVQFILFGREQDRKKFNSNQATARPSSPGNDSSSTDDDDVKNIYSSQRRSTNASPTTSTTSSLSKDQESRRRNFETLLFCISRSDSSLSTSLKLDGRADLSRSQWERLFGALEKNSFIDRISLRRCGITDDIAFLFAVCLMENQSIKSVDLRDNRMTDESTVGFLKVLTQSNTVLAVLKLEGNADIDRGTSERKAKAKEWIPCFC